MFNLKLAPTAERFLASKAQVKLICGPVGGGKSTDALIELLRRSMAQQAWNGVRRSKAIILRNTMQQLQTTVKPLIDEWMIVRTEGKMGAWFHTRNTFHLHFRMGDGTVVDSEWMMMPADTPDDVRRLLSVEASFGWAEECREIDAEVFRGFRGRLNRWPNQETGGVTEPGAFCSTNPPPIGSYWHTMMTEPPVGWEIFTQPPAMLDDGSLNPNAENLENLAPGYYENLTQGASPEWIDVYLKNKFGLGNLGQPVFRNTFKRDFHVLTEAPNMVPMSTAPLLVGMDNGLTAAAVVGQMDPRGRVNVLAECYVPLDHSMGIEKFMDTMLIPLLNNQFPVKREHILFVLDPACFARSQLNEVTIAQAVAVRGYKVLKASTNEVERRIAAVEQLLLRQVDGKPGLAFGPNTPFVQQALEWGYRFKRTAQGQLQAAPDKNHYSHIADALQYLCLHYNAQVDPAGGYARTRKKEVKHRPYAYV